MSVIRVLTCLLIGAALAGCPAPPDDADPAAPEPGTDPAPPPGPANATGPALTFDEKVIDFGTMREDEQREGKVWFRNTGSAVLEITKVSTTCGCTVAQPDKQRYEPGERGWFDVEFDPSAPGDQQKYVDVIANTTPANHRIAVRADVDAFIDIEPRFIELGEIEQGVDHDIEIRLGLINDTFKLIDVSGSNPDLQVRIDESRSTAMEKVVICTIPASAPWGPFFSWFQVTAEGSPAPGMAKIRHTPRIRIQARLFGALSADPNTLRFGAKPDEAFDRSCLLRHRDGKPFTITGVKIDFPEMPGCTITVTELAGGGYELRLNAPGSSRARRYTGFVRVTTDVPGQESIAIPINGVVRGR